MPLEGALNFVNTCSPDIPYVDVLASLSKMTHTFQFYLIRPIILVALQLGLFLANELNSHYFTDKN